MTCMQRAASQVGVPVPDNAAARDVIGLGLIGLGLNSLLTWDMHVVHHQSYLSMALLSSTLIPLFWPL